MNKKHLLACLLVLAAAPFFLLQGCSDGSNPVDQHLPPTTPTPAPGSVTATLVAGPGEVANGVPGSYFISDDRLRFHLRCPCGRQTCTKSNALPLEPANGPHVWRLSVDSAGKPTLSPSIHWFETDGATTHWHGWLRNGVFAE